MRITDPGWCDFLVRLRYGRVQSGDLTMLPTLLQHRSPIDFSSPPWNDAFPITRRHGVRTRWSDASLCKACSRSGQRLFVCHAEDAVQNQALSLSERFAPAAQGTGDGRRTRKNPPEASESAARTKVMLTSNIVTDLDITNGVRGTVIDIILDPDEPMVGDKSIIPLKHLPLQCVLARLCCSIEKF